ncbi:YicC family protein [Jannaschia sp. S6380]|uniref:YicC/YloC family endoribonuclease n=1 Tax=Jannaschia sp. S6380 TaxID=2926408 RepID=UPI001FF3E0B1|nr:YicC/YloC family endoribonuclease [Jannaschia sp. S6380]MCK0166381.1 YicC family protein [Jannaschia sp. S6380]
MKSMTGYAALDRDGRRWELRSVNARGLDIRLRLPDLPGLEPAARAAIAKVAARGSVTLSLRTGEAEAEPVPTLDPAALDAAIAALAEVRAMSEARGLPLASDAAANILALRGVFEMRDASRRPTLEDAQRDLAELTAAFDADRRREGKALRGVLDGQLDRIAALTADAVKLAGARGDHIAETFRAAMARIVDQGLDEARVRQDVATLAIKADLTEELDRLSVHVAAARDLLAAEGPVGRRLDFLTQEFNREANTLCSKANMAEMTTIGLDLKSEIDRLREQVQNVE